MANIVLLFEGSKGNQDKSAWSVVAKLLEGNLKNRIVSMALCIGNYVSQILEIFQEVTKRAVDCLYRL